MTGSGHSWQKGPSSVSAHSFVTSPPPRQPDVLSEQAGSEQLAAASWQRRTSYELAEGRALIEQMQKDVLHADEEFKKTLDHLESKNSAVNRSLTESERELEKAHGNIRQRELACGTLQRQLGRARLT